VYFLPIVQRELLVAARRGAIYRTRYWAGAIAGLGAIGALSWASNVWTISVAPGQFLFYFAGAIAFLFCAGSGIALTLDAISSEKRQGTLGLLFLTELHGYDIVLGKLASAAGTALSSFLTIFPILALSVCLGGVTGDQFWRLCIGLLSVLWFSLCLGLAISALVSVINRESWGLPLFVAAMMLPTIVTVAQLVRKDAPSTLALLLNPLCPILSSLELPLGSSGNPLIPVLIQPVEFSHSVMVLSLAGVLFLMTASLLTPMLIRDRVLGWRMFGFPRRQQYKKRAKQLDAHPVVWMEVRGKQPLYGIWTLFLLGIIFLVRDPFASLPNYTGIFYALYLHYSLKWMVAFQASRFATQEKETGFLETLLTTPITPGIIINSKRRALRRYFLLPLLYALAVHGWVIMQAAMVNLDSAPLWIAVASSLLLLIDFFSFFLIGLWEGLVAANSYRAFIRTILLGVIHPWLPFFVITGLFWFVLAKDFKPNPTLLFTWGFVSAGIFGSAIALWCFARLHFSFRRRLAEGR
jgi:ABC-type transport system involved in multi-copper enzyme maturation permease subunit